jgi:hypothetical protein
MPSGSKAYRYEGEIETTQGEEALAGLNVNINKTKEMRVTILLPQKN